VILRKDADTDCTPNLNPYDSVTTVTSSMYTDQDLNNENYYWYKVKSIGEYDLDFIPSPLLNYSQEICVSPEDTTPPCALNLSLDSDCDLFRNYLTWSVNEECAPDIEFFLIYYSSSVNGPFLLIDTVTDNEIRTYTHAPETSLGACYVVSAQDSAGNYLLPEQLTRTCIDKCEYYHLPNVFTPNGDGINDLFTPLMPFSFVEKIDMTVYNRWGNPVFKTEDPFINWDGSDFQSGKPVSDGVYYYICDVYEKRLSGTEIRNIAGFIRIITNSANSGKE